ncbi:MAG TPA: class I SAM-dependent methyltransferase [Pirellulales bacterium]|jgi:cyclopropane fatty-acyl-phospholipid synthase-like methyltransferase|nr:class I SAM-dependent methyltransferase [Pirellulales bacterium]
MGVPDREIFEKAYTRIAPWDIDGPQSVFVAAAPLVVGSVLDAGCGTGENALFFASRGQRVTGVDYLSEPIARAKRKAAERGLAATFLVLNALDLGELPEQFDSAIDSGLFHVFADDDRARYVAALTSVVRPGGKLFLCCFSDAEPGETGPRRITKAELAAAFAPGWTVCSIEPARFQARPDFTEMEFSPGGPHAWFAIFQRQAD